MSKRPATSSTPADAPGFEQSLEQLEAIIERIETGEIGLEASIAEYERGVGLLKRCREILKRSEQRVEELSRELARDAGEADPGRGKDRDPG